MRCGDSAKQRCIPSSGARTVLELPAFRKYLNPNCWALIPSTTLQAFSVFLFVTKLPDSTHRGTWLHQRHPCDQVTQIHVHPRTLSATTLSVERIVTPDVETSHPAPVRMTVSANAHLDTLHEISSKEHFRTPRPQHCSRFPTTCRYSRCASSASRVSSKIRGIEPCGLQTLRCSIPKRNQRDPTNLEICLTSVSIVESFPTLNRTSAFRSCPNLPSHGVRAQICHHMLQDL